MTTTKTAVGYIRVSTDMQIDGYSLDFQEQEIKAYCLRNNITLDTIYRDEGISGKTMKDRPGFQQMFSDIASKKNIDTILVYKISRFSRNFADLATSVDLLEKYGTSIVFIADNFDTSTFTGKTLTYITGIMSEIERENIVSTCRAGMRQRAQEGYYNGGRSLGYKSNGEKELQIMEEEADIVRQIFDLFVNQNYGYKKIALTLNNRGIKTLRNNDWSINSVKTVIDNPIYAGYIRWGKYKDWSKKRRNGLTDDYVFVKGHHIPIIDHDTWEKAQNIRNIRGTKNAKTFAGDYILTGLLKCPVCGASMISNRTRKKNKPDEFYRYYQCSTAFNKGSSVCKTNLINADEAEAYVIDKLIELVNSPHVVDGLIKKLEKQYTFDLSPLKSSLNSIELELNKINRKRQECLDLEYRNQISLQVLEQRLCHLNALEDTYKQKKASVESEIAKHSLNKNIDFEMIKPILKNFKDVFMSATSETKKQLLSSLISEITITNGLHCRDRKVKQITLFFEPEDLQAHLSKNKLTFTYGRVHRTSITAVFPF